VEGPVLPRSGKYDKYPWNWMLWKGSSHIYLVLLVESESLDVMSPGKYEKSAFLALGFNK
jgi:hypothetical protein